MTTSLYNVAGKVLTLIFVFLLLHGASAADNEVKRKFTVQTRLLYT